MGVVVQGAHDSQPRPVLEGRAESSRGSQRKESLQSAAKRLLTVATAHSGPGRSKHRRTESMRVSSSFSNGDSASSSSMSISE